MLNVIDLHFDYADVQVLQSINFSLEPGRLMHLRGQNGKGKTTLLKLLAGLLHPLQGEIRYKNLAIQDDLQTYQQQLCYVGHKTGISLALTIEENCRFDLHRQKTQLALDDLLVQFNLSGLAKSPCHLLSAGQRRRVGLLRLLMSNASLWLLDEPFVALDQENIDILANCLNDHITQGGQVILTSHQSLPTALSNYQDYCL